MKRDLCANFLSIVTITSKFVLHNFSHSREPPRGSLGGTEQKKFSHNEENTL